MARGEEVYLRSTLACATCHQASGRGVSGAFPPLHEDWVQCDKAIPIVLFGMSGPITVDGVEYNGVMTPQAAFLDDQQVADVVTYVGIEFGKESTVCSPQTVAAMRAAGPTPVPSE